MTEEKPVVSVVMPTYNRRNKIVATLESLRRQNYPLKKIEIIVVDDNSSESSEDFLLSRGHVLIFNVIRKTLSYRRSIVDSEN